MLTQQQLLELAQQLPPLTFVAEEDCNRPGSALAAAYLNFYQINFAEEFPGIQHGFGNVTASGFRIATHYWLPHNAKGTLVINHGLYDHSGIYRHSIRFALQHQLAVLIFDLPGHGLSSGEPTDINSFDQYADVLATILEKSQLLLPQPLYALSQSTGSATMLNYLWRYAFRDARHPSFKKIAVCAPLVLGRGWRLGKFLYLILRPCLTHLKRGISNNSHDHQFIQFITSQDPLQAKALSLKWVGAMKAWRHQFRKFSAQQKEVLIVQGTGDMTVDWRYNLPLIESKLPNAKVVMIADARHQLVNESENYRTQVFAAIEKYFEF